MNNLCSCCKKTLTTRKQLKYCSNKCQSEFQYMQYITQWKEGTKDGNRGITAKNISKHLKKYLLIKHGEKCEQCGWNKKHPKTNNVPLDIDHIDGNSNNNLEINLRLLCPNCHALTPSYKNHNKGKGREWRMKKYLKN